MTRTFESRPAQRQGIRLDVGFVGYSGSGKTFSMLRFAAGMAEAQGGKTVVIDTNLERSLHYAPKPGERAVRGQTFAFEIVPLVPPFGPRDFGAAFEHAIKLGATRILVDSMSDEWEGEGGVLDAKERMVDVLVERARRKDKQSEDWEIAERVGDLAWRDIKREHLALRLWMWQQPVNWLLGYRAKQKIDRKNKRAELGWQPLGAGDIVYDLMFKCLLPPAGDGHPSWKPKEEAEKLLTKQPGQFRDLFAAHPQINEELGYQIARWAAGHDIEIRSAGGPTVAAAPPSSPSRPTSQATAHPLIARYAACADRSGWDALELERGKNWKAIGATDKIALKAASEAAMTRIESPAPPVSDDEAAEIRRREAADAV